MAAQFWQKAPFLRLLPPLAAGIVVQWHTQMPLTVLLISAAACMVLLFGYSITPLRHRYRLAASNGFLTLLLLFFTGALLTSWHNVRQHKAWVGHHYRPGQMLVVTVLEPLVEKTASYKALGRIQMLASGDTLNSAEGKIILYFKKDSAAPLFVYGSQLLISKPLQVIKNSGNPGGFDYQRYSLFNGTTHQVYLTANEYTVLPGADVSKVQNLIYSIRSWVVATLKKYIPGEKESGLAEALLIGYKDDLDRNLVQAYSNTGVVHIIAISGLHLGIIYWLLLGLTAPLKRRKNLVWLRLAITLLALWAFTLLAGASPSVLRSALMFTVIAVGQIAARRSSIYNTLALSAFVLLCINPFWLWDVGFQLSYLAVLSIVLFFRPIYNLYPLSNKLVDFFWKLTAVTLAAQVLTLPVSIYHFHQMPLLFVFTNFIAVPLSSVVLVGEILLCAFSFFTPLAQWLGLCLHHLIAWMNAFIESVNQAPFAVWNGLSISIVQTALLLVATGCIWYAVAERKRQGWWLAASFLCSFIVLRGASFAEAAQQHKLIVYNVPKYTAIDVIEGEQYSFIGDSVLLYDDFVRNFHLQPSRILHRLGAVTTTAFNQNSFVFGNKQILLINNNYRFQLKPVKPTIDLLLLARNPKLSVHELQQAFTIKQIVTDGSVPFWKVALLKKECHNTGVPFHDVSESGAYVLKL